MSKLVSRDVHHDADEHRPRFTGLARKRSCLPCSPAMRNAEPTTQDRMFNFVRTERRGTATSARTPYAKSKSSRPWQTVYCTDADRDRLGAMNTTRKRIRLMESAGVVPGYDKNHNDRKNERRNSQSADGSITTHLRHRRRPRAVMTARACRRSRNRRSTS